MVDEHSMLHVAIQNLVVEVRNTNDKVDTLSKEMSILVSNQVEIKELRESVGRVFKRVEHIEHKQTTDGCTAHKSDLKLAEERHKNYEKLIAENHKDHEEFKATLKTIQNKPLEAINKFKIAVIGAVGTAVGGGFVMLMIQLLKGMKG